MPTVHARVSRAEVRRVLRLVPGVLAGRVPEARAAADAVLTRIGLVLLAEVKDAFVTKARGGTDEAGESWPPLQRATVANRWPAPRKRRGERPRGLLTAGQAALWRATFARVLHRTGDKGQAAQIAWAVTKRAGGKTKLDVYGGQKVEILRDTDLLLNSLSPGLDGHSGDPHQVFRTQPGAVIVGTARAGAAAHHNGVPGRLPQRRLWPERLPGRWWGLIAGHARAGVLEVVRSLLGGGV